MAFMENKKLYIINPNDLEITIFKSFENMMIEWEKSYKE